MNAAQVRKAMKDGTVLAWTERHSRGRIIRTGKVTDLRWHNIEIDGNWLWKPDLVRQGLRVATAEDLAEARG